MCSHPLVGSAYWPATHHALPELDGLDLDQVPAIPGGVQRQPGHGLRMEVVDWPTDRHGPAIRREAQPKHGTVDLALWVTDVRNPHQAASNQLSLREGVCLPAIYSCRRTAALSWCRMFSSPFDSPMMPFSFWGTNSPVSRVWQPKTKSTA